MTDHSKLRTLLVLVAIAMTWAYRCASRVMGVRGIPKKSHGRRKNHGFGSGLTRSGDGSCMTPKNPSCLAKNLPQTITFKSRQERCFRMSRVL